MKKAPLIVLAFAAALALALLALCACSSGDGPSGTYEDQTTGATITFRAGKATFEDAGTVHKFDFEMDGDVIVIKLGGGGTVTAYTYDAATDTVYFNPGVGPQIPFVKVK